MQILILLAVVGLMTAARSFEVVGRTIGSSTALAVGFLLITAYLMGWLAKQLGMPKLTGYLTAGLLAGDSVLALLPESSHADLRIFTGVAVSLIALTAGSELELRSMRPLLRTVGWLTVLAKIGTMLVLVAAVLVLRPWLPFMQPLELPAAIAIAGVLGVVLSANSPAVVVALRTETNADGPLCRSVLGSVVVGDLLVILSFGAIGAVAAPMFGSQSEQNALVHLLWHIGGSMIIGGGVAGVLWLYLRFVAQSTPLFVVALCFVVAEVGARIGLDPLLVALSAGILVRNLTSRGDALHQAIDVSALPVYLVFFAAAGASIHLDVLAVVGIPAVVLAVVRTVSYLGLSRIATGIAGASPVVRRWVGFGFLPQAGLALALALLMNKAFPSVGEAAGALVLGVVAINEMIAPVLYRWALLRSGEAGRALVEHSAGYPIVPPDPGTGPLTQAFGGSEAGASASASDARRVDPQRETSGPGGPAAGMPRTGDTLPPLGAGNREH